MLIRYIIFFTLSLLPTVLVLGLPKPSLISPSTSDFNPYVSFGLAFKKGDVPKLKTLALEPVAAIGNLIQVNPLAQYEDSSLKHAIVHLKVSKDFLETKPTLNFLLSSLSPKAAPKQGIINKNEILISIAYGGKRFEAKWSLLNRALKPLIRYSGPLCVEKKYHLPFKDDKGREHPHLAVVLNVREYEGGASFRYDVSVENIFSYVANPGGYEYSAKIYLNQKIIFEQKKLTHTHHSRWRRTFWDNSAGEIQVKDDIDYLFSTDIIPNYDRSVKVSSEAIRNLPIHIPPMEIGSFTSYMPQTGAQATIGPLPHFAAIYLLTGNANAKLSVLEHGNAGGTYQIHYKLKKKQLPITLADYPYLTLDAGRNDTRNPKTGRFEAFPPVKIGLEKHRPDDAHQPSIAFLPYLLTADDYYLEELHYWANYNVIKAHPGYREYEKGLLKWGQVRAQAWSLRTLAHAAFITPNNHPLYDYFNDILSNNIEYYNQSYGNSKNELGIVNTRIPRPWMDDYLTWAVGYVYQLGHKSILPFFEYKSRFPVLRMTPPFCWHQASIYEDKIFNADGSIFSKAEEYIKSNSPASCVGYEMNGYPKDAMGYGAFLQPALAIIYDFNMEGSKAAWNLYEKRHPSQDYSRYPQFAIVPKNYKKEKKPKADLSQVKVKEAEPAGNVEPFIKIKLNYKATVFGEIILQDDKTNLECLLGKFPKGEHTITLGEIKKCAEKAKLEFPIKIKLKSLDSFRHTEYISEEFEYK